MKPDATYQLTVQSCRHGHDCARKEGSGRRKEVQVECNYHLYIKSSERQCGEARCRTSPSNQHHRCA
eukprot:scaffold310_cov335-Pavlova_lutheri.AAC.52